MEPNHPPPTNQKLPSSAFTTVQSLHDVSSFRDQIRPAGYMEVVYSSPMPLQLGVPSYQWVNHRHPIGMHEAMWRQIEKERIREEIIAEEIARKRVLEAEVRRELLIERDMSMLREVDSSIYASYMKSIHVEPIGSLHMISPSKMEESSRGERAGTSALVRHEVGISETESQRGDEPRTLEFMTPPDTVREKKEVILLAKSEERNCGMKRKVEVLVTVGACELTSADAALKKKVKEEFSCVLCQVGTTSEPALKEHLQGKKHKAKEAALRNNGKNFNIGFLPKIISMPNEIPKVPSSPCLEEGVNFAESMKPRVAIAEEEISENSETNRDLVVSRIQQVSQTSKKAKACTTGGKKARDQKDFKFWCEMCQVGAFCEKVIEEHRKGKKHLARLLKLNKVSKPATQIMHAKQKMNLTDEVGEVVEGSTFKDSTQIIDDVKLDDHQEEAIAS